jgi:hypothetical protein
MVDFDVVTGPSTVTLASAAEPVRTTPDQPRPASPRVSTEPSTEPRQQAAVPRETVR